MVLFNPESVRGRLDRGITANFEQRNFAHLLTPTKRNLFHMMMKFNQAGQSYQSMADHGLPPIDILCRQEYAENSKSKSHHVNTVYATVRQKMQPNPSDKLDVYFETMFQYIEGGDIIVLTKTSAYDSHTNTEDDDIENPIRTDVLLRNNLTLKHASTSGTDKYRAIREFLKDDQVVNLLTTQAYLYLVHVMFGYGELPGSPGFDISKVPGLFDEDIHQGTIHTKLPNLRSA